MGSGSTAWQENEDKWEVLGLKRSDVSRLSTLFDTIDRDGSGSIDMFEFLMAVDIERSSFSAMIFDIFASDEGSQISFLQFALALWNFCSLGESQLCSYAFECFATKVKGKWRLTDYETLLNCIYGIGDSKERRMTQNYFDSVRGPFTLERWTEWTKHNSRALFPIFDIQHRMRRRCVGMRFWRRQQKMRNEESWDDIQKRLDSADLKRKRRLINFDDRTPLSDEDEDQMTTFTELSAGDNMRTSNLRTRGMTQPSSFPTGGVEEVRAVRKIRVVPTASTRRASRLPQLAVLPSPEPPPRKKYKPTDPIRIKAKIFVPSKRTRVEAVRLLRALRKPPKTEEQSRRRITEPTTMTSRLVMEICHNGPEKLAAAQRRISIVRAVASRRKGYRVFSEPSDLERACGAEW